MAGLFTRPSDTLLVERALDYLAGGPAASADLVSHVCQQPGTPAALADRLAAAIVEGHPDIVRDADGRWRRVTATERAATGMTAAEAGARPGGAAASRATPTFDEWLAAKRAAASAAPSSPVAGDDDPAPAASRPPRRRAGAARPLDRAMEHAATVAAANDHALSTLSYAVVDVETTGGSPFTGHRITEIAAVVVREGRVSEVFETLVNPERSIPPMISQLTNITWEMVRDKPPFRAIAADLVAFLRGHVFVAHNVNFDWRFVTAEVERATGQQLEGRRLCTVRLSRKLLPELPRRTLGHVAHHFGAIAAAEAYFAEHHPNMVWRHRAAGDAVATAHCLVKLLARAADRGCETWSHLDMLLAGGTGRARQRRRSELSLPRSVDRDTTA